MYNDEPLPLILMPSSLGARHYYRYWCISAYADSRAKGREEKLILLPFEIIKGEMSSQYHAISIIPIPVSPRGEGSLSPVDLPSPQAAMAEIIAKLIWARPEIEATTYALHNGEISKWRRWKYIYNQAWNHAASRHSGILLVLVRGLWVKVRMASPWQCRETECR